MPVSVARRTAGLGLALAALAWSCAESIVQVRESAVGPGQVLVLKRVAVAPFRVSPRPASAAIGDGDATLVAGYVADALTSRGLDVVPSSDVEQALGADANTADTRSLIAVARDHFGADAVVVGTLYRFLDRSGQAMGSTYPSSVGYEVKLFSAQGKVLWSSIFDHTQVALGENALVASQYPGGGTRWLTAEELARWGADEIAKQIPLQQ